jgi:hypothetical protein
MQEEEEEKVTFSILNIWRKTLLFILFYSIFFIAFCKVENKKIK